MCKITATDLGMCLPKCFVIVVNLFTFLLGSLIIGACMSQMMKVEESIGHDGLNFLFHGPIGFGAFVVFISFFGCCGAWFKNRYMLMTFAVLLLVVLAIQVGVVYIVYEAFASLNKTVNKYLMATIKLAKDESDDDFKVATFVWQYIQKHFNCCGVNSSSDWQVESNKTLPISCCPTLKESEVIMGMSQNATCNQSNAFPTGCKRLVTQFLEMIFHPVTVGVIIVLMIQLVNVIFSCCMFFVYGRKKRNANGMSVLATSPQAVHDHFIINKERF